MCCDGTIGDGADVVDDTAVAPFGANIDCGRAVDTPDIASALPVGHGPALCCFFRVAAVPLQLPRSPDAEDIGTPLACGPGCWAIVAVEDVEELEAIDEEEFAR
jgi:hypothetical protein